MPNIDVNHGLIVAIASLAIALCLNIAKWVFDRFAKHQDEKSKQSDQTRVDVMRLEFHLQRLEIKIDQSLDEGKKINQDLTKMLRAMEHLAGDKWPEIATRIRASELRRE